MACGTCGGAHPTPWNLVEAARCISGLGKMVESLTERVARLEAQVVRLVLCKWSGVDEERFRDHGCPAGHCVHCAAAEFATALEQARAVLGTGKLGGE